MSRFFEKIDPEIEKILTPYCNSVEILADARRSIAHMLSYCLISKEENDDLLSRIQRQINILTTQKNKNIKNYNSQKQLKVMAQDKADLVRTRMAEDFRRRDEQRKKT